MDIPLLPEREEDKKVASLLSMRLRPTIDIAENTEITRKRIISQSSLPCSFTPVMEKKALKILHKDPSKGFGIIRKDDSGTNKRKADEIDDYNSSKIKATSSLVDYGSSSESDLEKN